MALEDYVFFPDVLTMLSLTVVADASIRLLGGLRRQNQSWSPMNL